jgi:dethiobiotin synthetase
MRFFLLIEDPISMERICAMARGLFITGTDTGVGKTCVAAGIASALRGQGVEVGVMKPVETGCTVRKGALEPNDALSLMRAAKVDDDLDLVNPYRFKVPIAPSVAAAQEGTSIDMRRLATTFRKLARKHAFMIVEGAGGILVPLTARRSFLDLAALLCLPVLIVARPGLGTINHTLLTVMALRYRKLPIAGIVLNHSRNQRSGEAERTNPAVIEHQSGVPVIAIVRHGQRDFAGISRRLIGTY